MSAQNELMPNNETPCNRCSAKQSFVRALSLQETAPKCAGNQYSNIFETAQVEALDM